MGFIYKIWNEVNDNLYIGQTICPLQQRWSKHKQDSKQRESHLYLAMRKYGIDKFHIEQIEEVPDNKLNEREVYWIAYYNSYYDGYNSTLGGDGSIKYDVSIEEIEGLWNQGYGISEIADILGVSRIVIRTRIYSSKLYSEEEAQKRGLQKALKKKSKGIIQKTLEGQFIAYYDSGVQAQEKTGFDRKAISQALRNNGTSYGYKWEYANINLRNKNTQRKVEQYSKEGDFIATFNSVKEASEKTGTPSSGIYATCNGQQKTSGGYIWNYRKVGDA